MTGPAPTSTSIDRLLLQRLLVGPASGDVLAHAAGHTRAAVWKRIEAMRAAGVAIEARAGQGYRLAAPLELLDADAIVSALEPAQRAQLATCDVVWSLDSTNSEVLRRPRPVHGAVALLAERQTGGRGRRGRAWASPLACNLYMSVGRHYSGGLARLGGLGLVAGVAVATALRNLGMAPVGLKWPNDLVVAGVDGQLAKLGGLLVEGGGEQGGPVHAVVGIGINLRMPAGLAAAIDQPWTDLSSVAGRGQVAMPSRNAVAGAVLGGVLAALERFDVAGLAPFLPAYRTCDVLAGREVRIDTGQSQVRGTAIGVADDGALQVRIEGAVRSFHAGDVSVRRQ